MKRDGSQQIYRRLQLLKRATRRLKALALLLLVFNIISLGALLLLRDYGQFAF